MKQKSFEQLLKEEIRVDRLTPLQFSGILRAHAKYEIQSECGNELNLKIWQKRLLKEMYCTLLET